MRASRRLPPEALAPYLLDVPHPRTAPAAPGEPQLPEAVESLDWAELFGNAHPVEVEVGFGKGAFLAESGAGRPAVNFLGVEIERKYVMLTAQRLARRGLANVRLACTDARWFFRTRVAPASLAAVHVYFPDPWWKKRHHKRRVLTPEFLGLIAHALRPGGRFHFASDVQAYFDETLQLLDERAELRPCSELAEPEVLTNFERKYRLEGRPIYRTCYEHSSPLAG